MAADVIVIPTVMRIGFTGQFNGTSAADAGALTAKRIFGPIGTEALPPDSLGWIFLAKSSNAAAIKLGDKNVRNTIGDANEGLPRTAGQVCAGAVTDRSAKEVYQIAADALQLFYTGMVG